MSNCGKNTTFTTPPSKVLSLGVSGLAYLYAAGAKEKIVARANEYGEPAASWMGGGADDIRIAADSGMSVEGVIGLQPDLVYGGGFDSSQLPPERLIEKGIPAVVDQPECHYLYSDQKRMSHSTRSSPRSPGSGRCSAPPTRPRPRSQP